MESVNTRSQDKEKIMNRAQDLREYGLVEVKDIEKEIQPLKEEKGEDMSISKVN